MNVVLTITILRNKPLRQLKAGREQILRIGLLQFAKQRAVLALRSVCAAADPLATTCRSTRIYQAKTAPRRAVAVS